MAVNIWQRQQDETDKSYEAFEVYRDLGEERSLKKTTAALGYSSDTNVERWSSRFQWRKRVVAFDNSLRETALNSYKSSIDAFVGIVIRHEARDYQEVLSQWRQIMKSVETPQEFAKMMQAYDTIDRLGRRIARLPTSFTPETEIAQEEQEMYVMSWDAAPMKVTKTVEIPKVLPSGTEKPVETLEEDE